MKFQSIYLLIKKIKRKVLHKHTKVYCWHNRKNKNKKKEQTKTLRIKEFKETPQQYRSEIANS